MHQQIRTRSFKSPLRLAAIATAAVLGACVPETAIEQSWTVPTARTQPQMQRVVTHFVSDNATMRRAAEDKLARDLAAKGVQATPAYAIFGEANLADTEAVKARLRPMGYDGLVTMRIVEHEQELHYAPGVDGYWGYGGYPYYWGGGWGGGGYYYTEDIYRVETTAFSLRTNQVVWSALTRTIDPEGAGDLIRDTTEIVAESLTRRGLAG